MDRKGTNNAGLKGRDGMGFSNKDKTRLKKHREE